MATQVYEQETVSLQDDNETEVVLKPLVIGRLRRLMKAWKEFEELKEEEDSYRIFINCTGIALEHEFKGKFERLLADQRIKEEKNEVLSPEYKEFLENSVDMETMYRVMEICAGMKLNDPNLLAAAARAAEAGNN